MGSFSCLSETRRTFCRNSHPKGHLMSFFQTNVFLSLSTDKQSSLNEFPFQWMTRIKNYGAIFYFRHDSSTKVLNRWNVLYPKHWLVTLFPLMVGSNSLMRQYDEDMKMLQWMILSISLHYFLPEGEEEVGLISASKGPTRVQRHRERCTRWGFWATTHTQSERGLSPGWSARPGGSDCGRKTCQASSLSLL